MTTTTTDLSLHDFLTTPEAAWAAEAAVYSVRNSKLATGLEQDEVLSMALRLLVECALPPLALGSDMSRAGIGRRASEPVGGHVGTMYTWPEDRMQEFCTREISAALKAWLRLRSVRAA